jgi:hypothetical protein
MDEKEVVVVVVANGPTHHIPLPPFFGCDTSQQQHISTKNKTPAGTRSGAIYRQSILTNGEYSTLQKELSL